MKSESNPDLAQAASYALGASLQKTAEESHKSDVIDAIRQAWTQSESVGDRLALLDAMGNSGQPAYLPELRSVIDTRNWANAEEGSALRAKAVFALRFIRTSDAAQILAQALTEPDLRVRQAAVQAVAMASWNEIFRKPLQSCATSDSVASLQANCRSVLEAADRTVASR
jgi:HEAT repeat protein